MRPGVRWALALAPGLAAAGLSLWAAGHPAGVERWWQRVYPVGSGVLGPASASLPFSPTEAALPVLAAAAGWAAWRHGRRAAPGFLAAGGAVYLWFLAAWGLAYHRPPLETRWGLAPGSVSTKDLAALAAEAVTLANRLSAARGSPSLEEETRRLRGLVRRVALARDGVAPPLAGPARAPVLWRLLDRLGVDGVTSPFFHEVLLVRDLAAPARAAVLAHELAHSAGYAQEDAASLVGLLACLASPEPSDRYAAALSVLGHLGHLRLADGRPAREHLTPAAARDLEREEERQAARDGPVSRFHSRLNHLYLRTAGDPHGTGSYSRAMLLLAAARRSTR